MEALSRERAFAPVTSSPEAAGARLGELFRVHGKLVYGICRLHLRDPHEAEDAAQQAFLKAHQSLLAGTEPRRPAAWLVEIARNECRDRIRDRMRRPVVLDGGIEPLSESAEEAGGRRIDVDELRSILGALPRQQREAVVLRDLYGLSYGEVAEALGVSDSAVESLLFRARNRIQEKLGPLRLATGALVLPLGLGDTLARAIPGFEATAPIAPALGSAAAGSLTVGASSSGIVGGASASGGGGSLAAAALAKLASFPLAAKVVAATLAVGAAGTAAVESGLVAEPLAKPPASAEPETAGSRAGATPVSSVFRARVEGGPPGTRVVVAPWEHERFATRAERPRSAGAPSGPVAGGGNGRATEGSGKPETSKSGVAPGKARELERPAPGSSQKDVPKPGLGLGSAGAPAPRKLEKSAPKLTTGITRAEAMAGAQGIRPAEPAGGPAASPNGAPETPAQAHDHTVPDAASATGPPRPPGPEVASKNG